MKEIKLKNITLSNWKGQSRSIAFGDNENIISGRNKSGKTTLFKAWCWLISGYSDPSSPKNGDLFDNRIPVSYKTPPAYVEAVICVDEYEYKVRRTATAKFTRKRGTDIYEKASSDEYSYQIDDIDFTATDFQQWLNDTIGPEDMIRFMLDGNFFIDQIFSDKRKARQIIEQVVGQADRGDMRGDYDIIDGLIDKYTIDQIDTQASNVIKTINNRLSEIPALISAKLQEIDTIEKDYDFDKTSKDLTAAKKRDAEIDRQLMDYTERMKPQMEAQQKAVAAREMKQTLFNEAWRRWREQHDSRRNELIASYEDAQRQNERAKKGKQDYDDAKKIMIAQRDMLLTKLKEAELYREELIKRRDELKNMQMSDDDSRCALCGHILEGDALEKARAEFEQRRRAKLNDIVADGKNIRTTIDSREKEILDLQSKIDAEYQPVEIIDTTKIEKEIKKIVDMDLSEEAFAKTEQGQQLLAERDAIEIPALSAVESNTLLEEKNKIRDEVSRLTTIMLQKDRLVVLTKEIEDLRQEQRRQGSDLAKYERQREQVRRYRQEQIEIVSKKINDTLKHSKLEVWSVQKDGTVVPDLILKDMQDVSYATTNNASRIITAVDIQRFFCEKTGVNMPCFIDESAVIDSDNLPRLDGTQMFYLFRADSLLNIQSK